MSDLFPFFESFRLIGWRLEISIFTSPYRPEGILLTVRIISQISTNSVGSSFDTLSEVIAFLQKEYSVLSR